MRGYFIRIDDEGIPRVEAYQDHGLFVSQVKLYLDHATNFSVHHGELPLKWKGIRTVTFKS